MLTQMRGMNRVAMTLALLSLILGACAPAATGPDSVGAGDAFDAGLVWALLDERPLSEALGIACACGALSLRAAGGIDGQPTLDEALRLAAELPSAQ